LHSITQLVLTVRSVQKVTIVLMVFQRELLMAVYVCPSLLCIFSWSWLGVLLL